MELNRFKQLLESTMGNVKPLIMEGDNSYTLKNDKTLENSNTLKQTPELKIFKGAKFTKVSGAKELVADTKYQFVDSINGVVTKGPYVKDMIKNDDFNPLLGPIGLISKNLFDGKYKTFKGKVTYYCGIGKFKVKESTHEYFDEEKNLSTMLKGACNAKDEPITDPIVTPKSDHVCDTDKNSKLHKGKNYKYCKNGEKYYFKGIEGTTKKFKDKHPNWTLAKGVGLKSIKKMIGPVFDKM